MKNSSLRKAATGGFVKFYLENAGKFAEKRNYVSPTAADIAANATALAAATGGTAAPAGAGKVDAATPASK